MERFIIFLLWVAFVALLLATSWAMASGWFLLGIPLLIACGALLMHTLNVIDKFI